MEKPEIKKGNLYELKQVLNQIKDKCENDAMYRLVLIEMEIDKQIKVLDEMRNKPEFEQFQKDREAIIAKFAEKDAQGNPLLFENPDGSGKQVQGKGYVRVPEKQQAKLKKDLNDFVALKEDLLKRMEQHEKQWMDSLEEPVVDFNFTLIKLNTLPKLTYEQMKVMILILE